MQHYTAPNYESPCENAFLAPQHQCDTQFLKISQPFELDDLEEGSGTSTSPTVSPATALTTADEALENTDIMDFDGLQEPLRDLPLTTFVTPSSSR